MVRVIITVMIFLLFVGSLVAQGNEPKTETKEIEFEIKLIPEVSVSEAGVITELATYVSSDGEQITLKIVNFGTPFDAVTATLERAKSLTHCGLKEQVLDYEGFEVGIRFECKTPIEKESEGRPVILYCYGNSMYEASSASEKHLNLFEQDVCPHSYSVGGRSCPEVYLKRNWAKGVGR